MDICSQAEYDSPQWRETRAAWLQEWIGDPHAIAFIVSAGNIAEVWDDLYDGDELDRQEMMQAWRDALFGLERNPFYIHHRAVLSFHMEQLTLLWETANDLECNPDWKARQHAFLLKDTPSLLIPAVATLLHGYARGLEVSKQVWRFFPHETLDQWEFRHEHRRRN